jgi:hypothetical protein
MDSDEILNISDIPHSGTSYAIGPNRLVNR